MDSNLSSVLYEGLRVVFVLALPIVIAAAVSGIVVGVLQAATTIRDSASAYAIKLVAVLVVGYAMMPTFLELLQRFARVAIGGAP